MKMEMRFGSYYMIENNLDKILIYWGTLNKLSKFDTKNFKVVFLIEEFYKATECKATYQPS